MRAVARKLYEANYFKDYFVGIAMKRLNLFLILIVLVSSFALVAGAEEDNPTINETLEELSETLEEEGYGFNSSFDGEVMIIEPLKIPARILLGIPLEEDVQIEIFIVLISLWVAIFMLILGVLQLTSFMNEGYVRFLGALVITSLISLTGITLWMVEYLFYLLDFFDWIEKLGSWQIVLGILVGGLVILAVKKLMDRLGLKIEEEQDNSIVRNMNLLGTNAQEMAKQ